MKDKNLPTVGLACAGGVVEGAIYEIGALCALEEAIPGLDLNALQVYVGVSSGALITACLANGISARELSRSVIGQATDPTLNLQPETLFPLALKEYVKRLSKVPQVVRDTLHHYWAQPSDFSVLSLIAELNRLIPTGLFDNTALHDFLVQGLAAEGRTNDFRQLTARLRIVAMQLDTAEIACFGDADSAHIPIAKAVQASTALPGLYCPVEIQGKHYIDGVARRTVHASVALEEGANLVFCINPIVPINTAEMTNATLDRRLAEHGLPSVLSQTFRTLVYSRLRTGFRGYELRYPHADLIRIEPTFEDEQMFFSNIFSFSNRHAVAEHAYAATRTYLRDQAEVLEEKLARHGLALDWAILNDSDRRLYPAVPAKSTTVYTETDRALARLDNLLDKLEAQ